jgi:glycosyltransferase involved in cell wall biosynthesis
MNQLNLITIITPTYNEIGNIQLIIDKIAQISNTINYKFEYIIVDNCSFDGTAEIIQNNLNRDDINVKFIANIENRGPDYSSWVGLHHAKGDLIIVMVADFQDPLELIPKMISSLTNNSNIDSVICCNKENEISIRSILNKLFYNFLRLISLCKEFRGFQGYCCLRKEIVEEMLKKKYTYYYFRGLVNKTIQNPEVLFYTKVKRLSGSSSYNTSKLFKQFIVALNSQNIFFIPIVFLILLIIFENKIILIILFFTLNYLLMIRSSDD